MKGFRDCLVGAVLGATAALLLGFLLKFIVEN